MNWFKSLWLTSEEKEILKKAREEKLKIVIPEVPEKQSSIVHEEIETPKCYTKLIYSNKNITVVFPDGDYISLANIEQDRFLKVKEASSKEEIEFILIDKEVNEEEIEEQEDKKIVKDNLDIFRDHEDFSVHANGEVFMTDVNLPIPSPIIFSFAEILYKMEALRDKGALFGGEDIDSEEYSKLGEMYNALKMFWLKLALNSIPKSRESLLTFIKKNNVQITPNGNLVLYRRIVSKKPKQTDSKTLVEFVSQEYYRIKKMKKAPKNYIVYSRLGEYQVVHIDKEPKENNPYWKMEGNLNEKYQNLSKEEDNQFVSSHSGKNGQLSIKIGSIYSIPEEEIDLDRSICASGGLHAAAVNYNYSGFGDTPVVVLVNPSKAITVPTGEVGKLRTTEMFVACVNDKPHGVHFDNDALSAFDEEYHDLSLQELEDIVKSKKFDKLNIKKTKVALDNTSITKINEILANRIKEIK